MSSQTAPMGSKPLCQGEKRDNMGWQVLDLWHGLGMQGSEHRMGADGSASCASISRSTVRLQAPLEICYKRYQTIDSRSAEMVKRAAPFMA
jgi:hypothetical protein